jgi:hypothetical protein
MGWEATASAVSRFVRVRGETDKNFHPLGCFYPLENFSFAAFYDK